MVENYWVVAVAKGETERQLLISDVCHTIEETREQIAAWEESFELESYMVRDGGCKIIVDCRRVDPIIGIENVVMAATKLRKDAGRLLELAEELEQIVLEDNKETTAKQRV